MTWVGLLLIAGAAVPLLIELARRKMDDAVRKQAPGQFVELSQGITHYRWYGPEKGRVLVCIHGLTSPSFVWTPLASGLGLMGYRVLTYDLYGRGFSDRVAGLQNSRFFLRQFEDLLNALQIKEDLVLIGYSMGGAIVTKIAATTQRRIRHLVLLAPAGMGQIGGRWVRAMVQVPIFGAWAMLAFYPEILRRGLRESAKRPLAIPEIIEQQEAELNWRGFVPAVLQSLRGILDENLRMNHEKLAQETTPVIAIWGAQDKVIPLLAKDKLEVWNPNAGQIVFEDAGHELAYTHADRILDLLKHRLT
ncbi:MAG: alpha/beta hydrolase [Pseudomonadota bacterium]